MKLEQEHKQLATLWNRRMKKQCDANPMHLHWHAKVPEQPEHDTAWISLQQEFACDCDNWSAIFTRGFSHPSAPSSTLSFDRFPQLSVAVPGKNMPPFQSMSKCAYHTHTQVRNQVIMLWAMPSSMHLQAYSASQWVRVQMQSVTSHVFKEIPSASFSQISHESAHAGCLAAWQGGVSFNGFQNFVRQKPQAHEWSKSWRTRQYRSSAMMQFSP